MVSASEAAEEYRAVLSDLSRNDKTQINLLTILAEDYASYSNEIVKVIEDSLYTCSVPLKIVMLYVIDSIVKNVQVTGGYRELFAKKIVDMIVHVFKEGDERTRASIYRLRCTWSDVFTKSRLYMIDTKINSVDRAWPIMNPDLKIEITTTPLLSSQQQSQQNSGAVQQQHGGGTVQQQQQGHLVHVNPKFLNGKQSNSVVVKQEKQENNIKQEKREEKKKTTSSPVEANKTQQADKTDKTEDTDSNKKRKTVKKSKENNTSTTSSTTSKTPTTATTTTTSVPASKPTKEKETKTKEKSVVVKKEMPQPQQKPESLLTLKVELPKGGVGGSAQPPPAKRSRTSLPAQHSSSNNSIGGNLSKPIPRIKQQQQQPLVSKQNVPEPSRALGAHAFNVVMTSSQSTTPSIQSQPLLRPPTLQQQQQINQQIQQQISQPSPLISSQQQQLSCLQQQITPTSSSIINDQPIMIPQQQQVSVASIINQQQSQNMVSIQQSQIMQQQQQSLPPPLSFIKEQPPPQIQMSCGVNVMIQQNFSPIPNMQHNIQNVTPRLPGVPENNRIFVDGKAYEVFYLDQVAVIERNGLPHRVTFAGPPRDVIIDGIGHRMNFGEQKQVLIDGEIHLLRFGAPSRELYMGNFPFKGAFGGPPIIATINGRRHEIRLCGPPPEVRIDPEPCYELMRYMPAIRQQSIIPQQQQSILQKQTPKIEVKKDPVLDVTSLLQRLKNSGILTQLNQAEKRTQYERQAAIEARNTTLGRSNSPPVPCAHRFEHLERRSMPMAGFDLFSMRSLIIRYDSFIDSIHKQRRCCQHCGITFKELYGEAYQRHIDWHLQDTLKMKDPRYKYTRSQPWFMLEDWFNYSESELVNKIEIDKSHQQQHQQRQSSPTDDLILKDSTSGQQQIISDINMGSGGGGGLNVDATSDSIETKECSVCHEQFDEYWDEDEDVWRLRDCLVIDGKAFHVYCRDDGVPTNVSSTEDK